MKVVVVVSSILLAAIATTSSALQCNDAVSDRFVVEDGEEGVSTGSVPCTWLASRPSKQSSYCDPSHSSRAFYICQETCGACYDDCNDAPAGDYVVTDNKGILRECSWLRGRPQFFAELCPGDAGEVCPETCGTCPDKEFDTEMNPCDSDYNTGGCSVCGEGSLAMPVDFIVPGTPSTQVSCWLLQESGMLGQISDCSAIPDFIADLCECKSCTEMGFGALQDPESSSSEMIASMAVPGTATVVNTGAPTPTPSAAPSVSPSTSEPTSTPEPTTPTGVPSSTPTLVPTAAPTTEAPIDPTESPTASPTVAPTVAFLNNEFFNSLYRTLPDVDNEWMVLGIYLSGLIVLLLVLFFFCRCCLCMCVNKRKKYAAPSPVDRFIPRRGDDTSKNGTDPTNSIQEMPSFEQQQRQAPMPPPPVMMPDPVLDVVNPPMPGNMPIDAAMGNDDVYEMPSQVQYPEAESADYVYTSDSSSVGTSTAGSRAVMYA